MVIASLSMPQMPISTADARLKHAVKKFRSNYWHSISFSSLSRFLSSTKTFFIIEALNCFLWRQKKKSSRNGVGRDEKERNVDLKTFLQVEKAYWQFAM